MKWPDTIHCHIKRFVRDIFRFKTLVIISAATLVVFLQAHTAARDSGTRLTLLLTSNLQGRFATVTDGQDDTDPMLLLGQSIIHEREKSGYDLYMDLGNAFYPGPLSRYSYGSVMMDFFTSLDCTATLISSRDICIGMSSLEFLGKGRKTGLLSANIARDGKSVFAPYIIITHAGKKIGLIGVSSTESLFDIADRKALKAAFNEYKKSIGDIAVKLKGDGCNGIILLSGLQYRNNIDLMQSIPGIDLVISGGDSNGKVYSTKTSRIDLEWGRSAVCLLKNDGYYKLVLDLDSGIKLESMEFYNTARYKTQDQAYSEFTSRLSLWKEKFMKETGRPIAENFPAVAVTGESVASLLRHRFRCEIGILERDSVIEKEISGQVTSAMVMNLVANDYPIFTYKVTGAELKQVIDQGKEFIITGPDNDKIQGYPIDDSRRYSVCSTQASFDRIVQLLRRDITFTNTWSTLQDELEKDIGGEKTIASRSFDYLNNRFRVLLDVNLSNFYDWSGVNQGENMSTPPGMPESSYTQWGMEDTINLTIYNRYHQLILTPYIYFIKHDSEYQQNLLRGTALYNYNLSDSIKPYCKSQTDTVLVNVEGRPVLLRETAGVSYTSEKITGMIGAGFEKQVRKPEGAAQYGIEGSLLVKYPLTKNLLYTLKLDSFLSSKSTGSNGYQTRAELTNGLTYNINTLLAVSLKHKWFYLHSDDVGESYKYSQFLISLDIKADFKFL